ncbi:hypothetical protein HLK59_38035 [Streptomyces sp. S3(2020)]|uniref:NlpC/P60 family protein n=1 Tax=Streptomyces sp. S3(2020) TaxID=2732044 RepID=UPI001489C286|nr:NlpC/P60 family protein [Streptomyces sp. S3(2020)]NNN36065.1 hypothetical protein [Streptomyces sp. S3(2020)]
MATGVMVGRGYVSIRPEFEGDWSRSISARASRSGSQGGSAFSKAFSTAIGAGMKGIVGGLGTALAAGLAPAAAGAAAIVPALTTAGAAAGALKLGLSGVGDAFKAAFANSGAQASSAASATKAVEAAQRGLANAQRSLADAQVQAAERVRDAQEQVADAERDLADAQREARDVQGELTAARLEATRALEDMNQRLAGARLDEREAVQRLEEAEKELKAAQAKPGTDPKDLEELEIRYERAKLNLEAQRTETQRLADDTAKANKAGIEGSDQVTAAKERIADANRSVADQERALAEAQAGVDQARAEGQRQIEDAQRAVADAAQAVADAQTAAAAQASAFDQAMAKLAPNARSFVTAVQGLAPAWNAMKLGVQQQLFEGLDSTITGLGRTTIPILRENLTETAGVWNQIAKNAAAGITEMAKTGLLDQILAGATANLKVFENTPKQIITAFGQLAVAAQPAFNQLMTGAAGAIKSFTDGIAKSFASGGLEQAITTAFDLLSQLGGILGDALGAVGNIMKAASDAGGQALAVVGSLFEELRRITAMPEVQSALRTTFAAIAQIAAAIAPVIGSILQAVLPLVAALAPVIAQIAQALGPALSQLATALGAALLPIVEALNPILSVLMDAIVQVVQAITPLLQPLGEYIGLIVQALLPALQPLLDIVVQVVDVLVGPLNEIIQALIPYAELFGEVIGQVFGALEPLIAPLVDIVGYLAEVFAGLYVQMVQTFIQVIVPLLPVFTDLVGLVVTLALQVLSALMPSLDELIGAGLQLLDAFLPLLPSLAGLATLLLELAVAVLPVILPPLINLAGFLVSGLASGISAVVGWVASLVTWLRENLGPAFRWLNDEVIQPVWRGIQEAIRVAWEQGIRPVFRFIRDGVAGVGTAMRNARDKVIKPVWDAIVSIVVGAYDKGIRPAFDALKTAVGKVSGAFDDARKAIKTAWDKLEGIAKKPVSFVINTVYNRGIVAVWNKIASAFGAPELKEFHPKGFARGGVWNSILPGYTPGRDVHRFVSPTGGALDLSGGESIFRPEFTRAVGSKFVNGMNYLARSGGAARIREALAPVLGGNPRTPTDRSLRYAGGGIYPHQAFADGGIFGWIGDAASTVAGAGSAVWNKVKEGASWLADTLEASARAGVNAVVDPILKSFPGMDTSIGQLIRHIPDKILDALFGYSESADKKGAGGIGGPRIQAALTWAKKQDGKPYLWGGVGPQGFDCSGLMGAIENVIRGVTPNSRRWATGAFSGKTAPPGWVYHGDSAFRVGITNRGVGHTAGTLGKTAVESRGGDGVVIGKGARGYNSSLFTDWYGFQPGKYDQGGWLQPGWNFNGLGTPEPVLTPHQLRTLEGAAAVGVAAGQGSSVTYEINARTADFTVADLERVQRVQEARARVGRPR